MLRPFLILAAVASSTVPAESHEFWIDPENHMLAPGDTMLANLRVGQEYEGSSYSYIPDNFDRFEIAFEGDLSDVAGRVGDRPALNMAAPGQGLVVVVHETRDYELTYNEFQKFVDFVEHKDATEVIAAHREMGLPETGFKEMYSRYAKSLIAVGNGEGQDRDMGLLTEIVALENPYTGDVSDGVDVRLLYEGQPRGDAQIEIFEKAPDDAVVVTLIRTDMDGVATVPVRPGHRYMLDAVVLREVAPEMEEITLAVWESLWANLTFEVPAAE